MNLSTIFERNKSSQKNKRKLAIDPIPPYSSRMATPSLESLALSLDKEILVSPVQLQWIAYANGARLRVQLGNWNFDKSFFVDSACGDGATLESAKEACFRDYFNPPVMNEDSMMLGE